MRAPPRGSTLSRTGLPHTPRLSARSPAAAPKPVRPQVSTTRRERCAQYPKVACSALPDVAVASGAAMSDELASLYVFGTAVLLFTIGCAFGTSRVRAQSEAERKKRAAAASTEGEARLAGRGGAPRGESAPMKTSSTRGSASTRATEATDPADVVDALDDVFSFFRWQSQEQEARSKAINDAGAPQASVSEAKTAEHGAAHRGDSTWWGGGTSHSHDSGSWFGGGFSSSDHSSASSFDFGGSSDSGGSDDGGGDSGGCD